MGLVYPIMRIYIPASQSASQNEPKKINVSAIKRNCEPAMKVLLLATGAILCFLLTCGKSTFTSF